MPPILIKPSSEPSADSGEISCPAGEPVQKDSLLLCEQFDITPAKRRALLAVLRERTDEHSFKVAAFRAIEPNEDIGPRAKAVAEVSDVTVRHGRNIVSGGTDVFQYWPLMAAAWLDVFTLRGAVLGVQMATGMHPEDIEALIRRHLGPEVRS